MKYQKKLPAFRVAAVALTSVVIGLTLCVFTPSTSQAVPSDSLDVPTDSLAAAPTTIAILETHAIEGPGGERRILLRPGDLTRFDGELVLAATLEIPLASNPITRSVDLRIYPVTAEWSTQATWDFP